MIHLYWWQKILTIKFKETSKKDRAKVTLLKSVCELKISEKI